MSIRDVQFGTEFFCSVKLNSVVQCNGNFTKKLTSIALYLVESIDNNSNDEKGKFTGMVWWTKTKINNKEAKEKKKKRSK